MWVDHFRAGLPTLVKCLDRFEVATHPFVIGELALGNVRQRETSASVCYEDVHLLGLPFGAWDALVDARQTPKSDRAGTSDQCGAGWQLSSTHESAEVDADTETHLQLTPVFRSIAVA